MRLDAPPPPLSRCLLGGSPCSRCCCCSRRRGGARRLVYQRLFANFRRPAIRCAGTQALGDAWQLQFAAWNSLKVARRHDGLVGAARRGRRAGDRALPRRWRACSTSLFMSPLVLPALAFGLASLIYFSRMNISLSANDARHRPLGRRRAVCHSNHGRGTLAARPALLESSASLGATPRHTFRRVTLPLIGPGMPPAPSSRSCRRSTTCRCRCSCATRVPTCCRSACGRTSKAGSTSASRRCRA